MMVNTVPKTLDLMCKTYVASYYNIKEKVHAHNLDRAKDKDLLFCASFLKAYEDAPPNEQNMINSCFFDRKPIKTRINQTNMKFLRDLNVYINAN